jgi:cytochrome d ubiquinol oxidase subunit I
VDVNQATPEIIEKAVNDTVPKVTPMFWGFRIMVGLGFAMLLLFLIAFWSTLKTKAQHNPILLKIALFMLPAPGLHVNWVGLLQSMVGNLGRSMAYCQRT